MQPGYSRGVEMGTDDRKRVITQDDELTAAAASILVRWVLPVLIVFVVYAISTIEPKPPHHRVLQMDRTPDGRLIRLAVQNSHLSKEDCAAIAAHYRSKAGRGQVVVEKLAPTYDGKMHPFCYDNQDGKGVQFNDWPFNAVPDWMVK